MSSRLTSLGIDQLSVKERSELIDDICDSLPEEIPPEEIPDWHLAEIANRRARAEAEPGKGIPFRKLLDELEARP
jgi:putative addiction module component (TIGR02574 family)